MTADVSGGERAAWQQESPPAVVADVLSKSYGEVRAVVDVSLQRPPSS